MSPDDVLTGVAEVVATVAHTDPGDLTPQTSFAHDLGLDSLAMAGLIVAAEDRFGVVVADDAWSGLHTVSDLTRYLRQAMVAPA
ncbi:acyl carrier protein [Planosporangium thailandense]|uniref:Acyl carrier protein n=1 Tax=Planosporangium thailandense TaxID=765197 RepID=A0ABX0XZG7_9ACTN|nr:acyl carrier protein [Planosporangium thailandense]NJC71474.1 acyl carrier protein [Planosporangium thailandense]